MFLQCYKATRKQERTLPLPQSRRRYLFTHLGEKSSRSRLPLMPVALESYTTEMLRMIPKICHQSLTSQNNNDMSSSLRPLGFSLWGVALSKVSVRSMTARSFKWALLAFSNELNKWQRSLERWMSPMKTYAGNGLRPVVENFLERHWLRSLALLKEKGKYMCRTPGI